jgi:branched-chain amino acid transport system substrate-binding protein
MKKQLVIGIAVVAAAVLVGVLLIPRDSENKVVRIPINVPLTGPIAAWSGEFPNGFQMGIEDACKEFGLDPKTFAVDAHDNAADPKTAVSIFRKDEIKGFDTYITVTTGAANALSPLLDESGKPHFIAAFDPFIVRDSPPRFRLMANSKIEAPLFLSYAESKKPKKVFIAQLDFSYAEDEFGKIVEPALKTKGIETKREKFKLEERDFKTLAQKAKEMNPDLIFLCAYSFHLQQLIQDLRSAGLATPGRIMTSMDFVDLLYTDTPRETLNDVVFACPFFDIPGKITVATEWKTRFKKRFGVTPTYVPAYAYDNAYLLVRTYSQSKKIDRDSIYKAQPFDGINGRIAIDEDGDVLSTVTLATLNANGEIVELQ